MANMVIIQARRDAYSKNEVRTITVKELIQELEQYDEDAKVVLSHDNGYTYGGITERHFREEEDEEEDEDDDD